MITGFRRPLVWVAPGVLAVLAVLIVTTIACQRVALLAPNGSTITLTSFATTLPFGGTTNLIAQVIEPAGTPPQRGTLVTFTTSLGTTEPVEAETDLGGRVMVTFKAGTLSGTATITALSGGVTTGTTGAIKIAVGAAGVASIGMTAAPPTISPGGKSTITATVSDPSGTVIASVPVTFTTDNGSLNPSIATTDASGNATTTLTTNKTAKVTATAGTASTTGTTTTAAPTASVTVTVEPLPTASISASANPQVNVPVTFTIAAQVGAGGAAAIQSVIVDFGDGRGEDLGASSGTGIRVDHVYETSGAKTARVTVTDTNGGKTAAATVVFVQTQVPIVSLTIASTATPAAGTKTVNFVATVTPASTSVAQYVWNWGDGGSQTTFTGTNSHDYATATLPRTATVTITTTTLQTASSSTTVSP